MYFNVHNLVTNLAVWAIGPSTIHVQWILEIKSATVTTIPRCEVLVSSNSNAIKSVIAYKKADPVVITGLDSSTEYTVQVRTQTSHGWGEWSEPATVTTYQNNEQNIEQSG